MKRSRWQPQAIHDPNLVLYLPLRHMEARITQDRSAHGHTLTPTGCYWTKQGWQFDGIDDILTCGTNASMDFTGLFSYEAWAYNTRAVGIDYGWLIGKQKSDGSALYTCLQYTNAGKAVFVWRKATVGQAITGSTVLDVNRWYHVVGVYDGSLNHLYINGKPDATPVAASGVVDTLAGVQMSVGKSNFAGDPNTWAGILDSVRAYNRPLSPLEVNNHFREESDYYGI